MSAIPELSARLHATGARPRALLSLREAALLADVPEAKIRKDIETGILPPIKASASDRLLFRWADVFLFAALYRNDLLSSTLRRSVIDKLEALLEPTCRREFFRSLDADALAAATCAFPKPSSLFESHDRVALDRYLFIDIGALVHDLAPRVDAYAEGLTRIEEQEGVLGGETIFKGTRLSVRHIGKMHRDGELIDEIIADYPYLRPSDVEFAALFVRANPTPGRPPASSRVERARGLAS